MAHAFRSAALIEAENAQRKLDRLRDRWVSTRDSWYDGTVNSVDRRIGHVDEVISFAKNIGSRLYASKVGGHCLAMLPELKADRHGLEALRERLLIAGEGEPGLITGPEDIPGYKPLSPDTLTDMRSNISNWNDGGVLGARQAALDFIENQNTTDRQELLIRAQRLVEDRTWDWAPDSARQAVRDFLGAVDAQIPTPVRHAQRTAGTETVEDFDDQLMFSS